MPLASVTVSFYSIGKHCIEAVDFHAFFGGSRAFEDGAPLAVVAAFDAIRCDGLVVVVGKNNCIDRINIAEFDLKPGFFNRGV